MLDFFKKMSELMLVILVLVLFTVPAFALDISGTGLKIISSSQTVGADATFYTRNSTVNQGNSIATGGCSTPIYDMTNTAGVWQADFLSACILGSAPVNNATSQPEADLLGGIQLINFKGLRVFEGSSLLHGGFTTALGFSIGGAINQVTTGTLTLPNGQATH
jgi:hypothetical protein